MSKTERWALRVPANEEGERFTDNLRKNFNKGRYKAVRRWTGPRPKGTDQHSTSRENATSARLYIDDKFPNKFSYNHWYDEVLNRYISKDEARKAIQDLNKLRMALEWVQNIQLD